MKLLPRQLDGGALVFVEPFQYTVAIDAAMKHQGQLGPHHVITSERFEPNVMEAHPELKSGQPHHHAEVRCMRIHEACERQLVQGPVSAANGSEDTLAPQDVSCNRVYGACFERKTVNDLVSRSAKGDHMRQLRRLQMSNLS